MALKINIKLKEYGQVVEVKQDVISVTGLNNCMNGQLVQIGKSSWGVIVGFDIDYVLVLLVYEGEPIRPGDEVITTMDEFKIKVGSGYIGRVVNALGYPLDGKPAVKESKLYPIFNKAPSVLERIPLKDVLETGIKIIDMTLPIGKGQRMLLLGDRMTGKTSICLDIIINQKGKDVICIYCCIGKSETALEKVKKTFARHNVWEYGLIVAATAADPMGQQYLAPYVATSIGEYFMYEEGKDVLVIFDDFTKHAWAYRQISLLLERPPGRDAYPGDIFYIHSQLVERACKLSPEKGGGSMTHIPVVETQEGDFAGYIPSNTISMTDGQIYLNTNLFGQGFKPAIDMGLSVSRIGNRVQWTGMKARSAMLKMEYIRYKELERMTRIKAGVSAALEEKLNKGRCLEEFLKQPEEQPVGMEDQIIGLYVMGSGIAERIHYSKLAETVNGFIKYVHERNPQILVELRNKKDITDKIKEELDELYASFFNSSV